MDELNPSLVDLGPSYRWDTPQQPSQQPSTLPPSPYSIHWPNEYERFKRFIDDGDLDGAYKFIYEHPDWVKDNSQLIDSLINPLIQRVNSGKDLEAQKNAWINNGFSPYYLQNQNLNLFSDSGFLDLSNLKQDEYSTHEKNQDAMKAISIIIGLFAILAML